MEQMARAHMHGGDFFVFMPVGRHGKLNLIKKFGLDLKCGFYCELRPPAADESVHYPACAALERKKTAIFVFWRPQNAGFSMGILIANQGRRIFFCGRREQKAAFPPCAHASRFF